MVPPTFSDYQATDDAMATEPSTPLFQNSAAAVDDGEKDDTPPRNNNAPSRPWGKILVGLLLLGAIIFVIVDSLTTKHVASGFQNFLEWIETNLVAGLFAFIGIYFVATVAFVPGSVLTLGSGFVFGKALGLGPGVALASVAVFVGASLGAIASFLLGRYLLKDWVERRLVQKYPSIRALDEAFKQQGFRIFVLLRLSPIIPFNAINYIGGVTSIDLAHYVVALLFILPGTVLYCFIGASAGSLTESGNGANSGPVAIASIVVGIVFGLLAVFAASYYAKREFNRIVTRQGHREDGHGGLSVDSRADGDQPQQQGDEVA